MGVIEFLFALAQDMILAAIPAVGFAMVFNVPVRALRWCALLGAIGHGSRMILMTSLISARNSATGSKPRSAHK